MRFLRVALFVLLGVVCFAAALVAAVVAAIVFPQRPNYDHAHPDHAAFSARFAQAREAFAAGQDWVVIDLAPVNGGDWRTACLFGGFSDPLRRLEEHGAIISAKDRRRLSRRIGLRLSVVEEFEMMIAAMDTNDRTHAIHFQDGVGAEGQHHEACVTRPRTKVALQTWRAEEPLPPPPLE